MLADLVGHRPLMAFFGWLRAKINESSFGGSLCPASLWLFAIEADDQAQMPLRQINGIDRRLLNARCI